MMKKLLALLSKAKKYIGLALKYLGQLLGIVKKVEEELKEQDSDETKEAK